MKILFKWLFCILHIGDSFSNIDLPEFHSSHHRSYIQDRCFVTESDGHAGLSKDSTYHIESFHQYLSLMCDIFLFNQLIFGFTSHVFLSKPIKDLETFSMHTGDLSKSIPNRFVCTEHWRLHAVSI